MVKSQMDWCYVIAHPGVALKTLVRGNLHNRQSFHTYHSLVRKEALSEAKNIGYVGSRKWLGLGCIGQQPGKEGD